MQPHDNLPTNMVNCSLTATEFDASTSRQGTSDSYSPRREDNSGSPAVPSSSRCEADLELKDKENIYGSDPKVIGGKEPYLRPGKGIKGRVAFKTESNRTGRRLSKRKYWLKSVLRAFFIKTDCTREMESNQDLYGDHFFYNSRLFASLADDSDSQNGLDDTGVDVSWVSAHISSRPSSSFTGKKTLLVTGFGPFGKHATNSSWEAVKRLRGLNIEEELSVKLVVTQIPVVYSIVDNIVPKLWMQHRPDLVIHVGAHNEEHIQIEECAHRSGYALLDTTSRSPQNGICVAESRSEALTTGIDIELILDNICNDGEQLNVIKSQVAGQFLCEYTYYTSLTISPNQCLFVHVPPYKDEIIESIALRLKDIIRCTLKSALDWPLDPAYANMEQGDESPDDDDDDDFEVNQL